MHLQFTSLHTLDMFQFSCSTYLGLKSLQSRLASLQQSRKNLFCNTLKLKVSAKFRNTIFSPTCTLSLLKAPTNGYSDGHACHTIDTASDIKDTITKRCLYRVSQPAKPSRSLHCQMVRLAKILKIDPVNEDQETVSKYCENYRY